MRGIVFRLRTRMQSKPQCASGRARPEVLECEALCSVCVHVCKERFRLVDLTRVVCIRVRERSVIFFFGDRSKEQNSSCPSNLRPALPEAYFAYAYAEGHAQFAYVYANGADFAIIQKA